MSIRSKVFLVIVNKNRVFCKKILGFYCREYRRFILKPLKLFLFRLEIIYIGCQCQDTVAIEVAMIATGSQENMMIEVIAIDQDHNTMVDEAMEPAIMVY